MYSLIPHGVSSAGGRARKPHDEAQDSESVGARGAVSPTIISCVRPSERPTRAISFEDRDVRTDGRAADIGGLARFGVEASSAKRATLLTQIARPRANRALRRAEAIPRVSTTVAGRTRCEPRLQ